MSQHLTDWYSYSHVLHGIIFYWLLSVVAKGRLSVAARLVIAMGIEAGWEIFENTPFIINRYRRRRPSRATTSATASSIRWATCYRCWWAFCSPRACRPG